MEDILNIPELYHNISNYRTLKYTLASLHDPAQRKFIEQTWCCSKYFVETNIPVSLDDAISKYKSLHVDLRVWTVNLIFTDRPLVQKKIFEAGWTVASWFDMISFIYHTLNLQDKILNGNIRLRRDRLIPADAICLVQERVDPFSSVDERLDSYMLQHLRTGRVWHWTIPEIITNYQRGVDQHLEPIQEPFNIAKLIVSLKENPIPLLSLANGSNVTIDAYKRLYEGQPQDVMILEIDPRDSDEESDEIDMYMDSETESEDESEDEQEVIYISDEE